MVGQMEQGAEGTIHYQGMLTTPQVRFSAVKKLYPRAHIEVAKNRKALAAYVQKEDTRIESVTSTHIPSIFEYQTIIAKKWNEDEYQEYCRVLSRKDRDDVAMLYLDSLVAKDIANGQRGAEWIATNPMWRNAWKKFWRVIITRENAPREEDRPAPSPSPDAPPDAEEPIAARMGVDEGNTPVCSSSVE